ncbi:MAG TPA: hypothetical protein VN840_22275 [Streptosporangiaceae bacterium]|nr:hypothetical protein [Streptosporangiaceae bacterium]
MNVHLKPGPELEKAEREVAEHQRFASLVEEVTAVSEAICAARPAASSFPLPAGGERGTRGAAQGDRRRRGRQALAGLPRSQPCEALGVLEQAMRAALASAAARLLEAALAGEDGYVGRTPGAAAAGRLPMRAAGKRR